MQRKPRRHDPFARGIDHRGNQTSENCCPPPDWSGCHRNSARSPTCPVGDLMRKVWCGEGDLVFGWLLIVRKLLILRYARRTKSATNAWRGHNLGTRTFVRSFFQSIPGAHHSSLISRRRRPSSLAAAARSSEPRWFSQLARPGL